MKQDNKIVPYHMQSPVLLAQPLLDRALSVFLTVSLVVAIVFCAATSYSRTESARGEIAAARGFSALVAEESGVIGAVSVQAGQRVAKGQVLARLSRPHVVVARGDTTTLSLEQGRAILANIDLQLAENDRSIAASREQISQIRKGAGVSAGATYARRELTEQRKLVASKRLNGLELLAAEGVVTQMAVDQARVQSMQLLQEAADADLAINEIARGRDERIGVLESKGRDLVQAAGVLRNERLQMEKQLDELQARQELLVVAPQAGIVAAVNIRPGQRVESGQRILAIASSDADLTAVLQVPSKAIGLIVFPSSPRSLSLAFSPSFLTAIVDFCWMCREISAVASVPGSPPPLRLSISVLGMKLLLSVYLHPSLSLFLSLSLTLSFSVIVS